MLLEFGGGIALLGAASLLLPWSAALDVEAATRARSADPDGALRRLDRAHDLNFLSSEADLLAAAIAGDIGDADRARAYYEAASDRDPTDAGVIFRLGALDAIEGHDSERRRPRSGRDADPAAIRSSRRCVVGPVPAGRCRWR